MVSGQEFQCISWELSVQKADYGNPLSAQSAFYGARFDLALDTTQKSTVVKE